MDQLDFISPLIADCQPSATSAFPREEGKCPIYLQMEELCLNLKPVHGWCPVTTHSGSGDVSSYGQLVLRQPLRLLPIQTM